MRSAHLDRLVLDAIEKYGPEADVAAHIRPYVILRMNLLSPNAIRHALERLEETHQIASTHSSFSRSRVYGPWK